MIDNYLEYVKICRENNLHLARWAVKELLRCEYGYAKGFYNGLQQAYAYSARDWKVLQKDIEAKQKEGYDLCMVYSKYPSYRIKRSLTGGSYVGK